MVIVSASDRASDVIRAVDLGAMGFVPKRASNATLFEALNLVMQGGIYVPPMTLGSEPGEGKPEGDTVPSYLAIVREQAAASRPRRRHRRWRRSASRRARPTCSACCCRASPTS